MSAKAVQTDIINKLIEKLMIQLTVGIYSDDGKELISQIWNLLFSTTNY